MINAFECKLDLFWTGAGCDDEIVFEALLVAVVEKVDSRINALIFDLGIGFQISLPVFRIVPEEVVDLAGQRADTYALQTRTSAEKRHTKQAGSDGGGRLEFARCRFIRQGAREKRAESADILRCF